MVKLEAAPTGSADLELALRGDDTPDLSTFVEWLKAHLQVPRYCRANLNSIEECLNDLSWLPKNIRKIRVRIEAYDAFMGHEPESVRTQLLDIFHSVDLPAESNEPTRAVEVSISPSERAEADLATIIDAASE
jgi:hypothetical protein